MDWRILTTKGRISRTHFAIYGGALWGASFLVEGVSTAITSSPITQAMVTMLLSMPIWWSTYCICVRRAHDMGHDAWFVVLSTLAQVLGILLMGAAAITAMVGYSNTVALSFFVVGTLLVVGSLMVMAMLLLTGPDQDNEWGPDPR